MAARNYRQKTTGKRVKGATTHLSVLAKPALIYWGFKQGMSNFERLMAELASFRAINIEGDKAIPFDRIEELIKTFQPTTLYDKRDKAADAGTLAHKFFENHIKGLPEPSRQGIQADVLSKAEGCYITFLDWEKANSVKYIASEVELTSEKFPSGGTIDGIIQGALTPANMVDILDYKTGKDIYLEAKIQVRAYKSLWEEHHPDLPVAGFHILRLGENGEFTHKYFPSLDENYWGIFQDCMDINERLERLGEKL